MTGTAPAECTGRTCDVPKGETLTIPLGDLEAEFAGRRQIRLIVSTASAAEIPPQRLLASIDGVLGNHIHGASSVDTAVYFLAFPDAPMTLELRYEDGSPDAAKLNILFHDYLCEQVNPAPPCLE